MKNISRLAGILIVSGALVGCGGLELFAVTGAVVGTVKTAESISIGFGRIVGDAYARALGCVLTAGFGVFNKTLEIEIETVEKNFVAEEIRAKKIVDPNTLFARIEPSEAASLRTLVKTAYDALEPKSSLRQRTVEFYEGLLAAGLLSAVKENVQVRYAAVLHHVGDKAKPESFQTFGLTIKFLHAGQAEPKIYSVCE